MSCWVQSNATPTGNECAFYNGNSGSNGWGIFTSLGGLGLNAQVATLFGGIVVFGSSVTLTAGLWYNLNIGE